MTAVLSDLHGTAGEDPTAGPDSGPAPLGTGRDRTPASAAAGARPSLFELEQASPFADRHIGPDRDAAARMLAFLGYDSLDALTEAAVPGTIRLTERLGLPPARSEAEVLTELRDLAGRNRVLRPMIGLGYYGTFTPPVILRNVLENPAWYTAYTPYQPEISQGRLEALLNFQTVVADLTGLPVANASLLDEGTAAAEAMTLARRAASPRRTASWSTPTSSRRPSPSSRPAPSRWASSWRWPTSRPAAPTAPRAWSCPKATSSACSSSTPAPPARSAT